MNTFQRSAFCLLTGLLSHSATGAAVDLGEGLANGSPTVLLQNKNNQNAHWNGIGKMFWGDLPTCTVTLLDTRDQHKKATGPAYVLTAAHCVGSVVAPAAPPPLSETVKFNYFNDTPQAYKNYAIKQTVWAEYQHTDLAILQLDASLSDLLKEGMTPLKLASGWSKTTGDVLIVGAPEELPEAGLRLAACSQEAVQASLIEGERIYEAALKNRCKDIRNGSSGSPVLERSSGQIVSVMTSSTYAASESEQCFENAPCEVKNGQPQWWEETHYGQPVNDLSGCFKGGLFTNVSNVCTPYRTFEVTAMKFSPTHYVAMPREDSATGPFLFADFSLSTPEYRYKTVREASLCRSPHYYSDATTATDAAIEAAIPREIGMHFLCIIGVESAEQRPSIELMKSAWVIPARLIARMPVPMPEPTITWTADERYTVKWRYQIPTHFGTVYYSGPTDDTDCNDVAREAFKQTFGPLVVTAEQLPLTLCSRNRDLTLRHSDVRSDFLALP